jgi:HD-GYP domain-containing protein (c-di-GMP phosphodiesterase class II)
MEITLFRRNAPVDEIIDDSPSRLCEEDLRHLVELERGQRLLLQSAYEETVAALARALEFKDTGTGAHSQRVQRYAVELADELAPELLEDRSVEYGFLLHDVGKIGIPDNVLRKPGPLDLDERRLMETHTLLGERMLEDLALLRGEGLGVVRSHHERWDGAGYPDGLAGEEIPLSARIFAVADALDAITNDRPYRAAGSWRHATEQIGLAANGQFDPDVVEAFRSRELALLRLHRELDDRAQPLLLH